MESMSQRSRSAQQLWELDRRHFLHPFEHFESFQEDGSLFMERGSGCELFDSEGKNYLDMLGGLWCTNIGLGREEMVDAIAEQTRKLAYSSTFTDMSNEPAARLAAKIAKLAPGNLNRVHFSTGGSTAIDSAFRLVHFFQQCAGRPDKVHVISRRQSYHGSTYASMSIGYKEADRKHGFKYIEDIVHHISEPDLYRAPNNMDEQAFADHLVKEFENKIDEVGVHRVGAFFAEPIMGAGGVLLPPADYLKRIRQLCTEHDILYVSDEVVTAFGRLGHWFASEDVFGIVPDIITVAKGLSSGYLPIGATIYSDKIHETISTGDASRTYTSGFTYAGHPVCCAAALKNIEIIERENLLEHASRVGAYFGQKLGELKEMKLVGDVRGMGLMYCLENVLDRSTKATFPEEVSISKRISDSAESFGVLVRPVGHLNIMSPPLIITESQIDRAVDCLKEALRRVCKELQQEGWDPV